MLKRYSQSRGCFCTLHETLTYAAGVNVHMDMCTTVHTGAHAACHIDASVFSVRYMCGMHRRPAWPPCMNRMPTAAVCVSGQGLP